MTDIYQQHAKAFVLVSAFVILDKSGDRIATIAFKFPRDGAGRLYAYVHWFGAGMVRGHANGYGYDKRSAACASAADRLYKPFLDHGSQSPQQRFRAALGKDGGWDKELRDAGFTVLQAV